MKIGTIDIGSNAARLLIVDVVVNGQNKAEFDKLDYIRIPLGLGFDVFETGTISQLKFKKVLEGMEIFRAYLSFYDVEFVKACATSALRDAHNGKEIIDEIINSTGIKIGVITGDEEAGLIYESHITDSLDKEHAYLYVDVGGGSTELTLVVDGEIKYRKSVNIGAIRILKNQVNKDLWGELKKEIKSNIESKIPLVAIGSGGNINKIFSLSRLKKGKPLTFNLIKGYYDVLSGLTVEERMHEYDLREERAKVIVPALQIYKNVMRWANIQDIHIPQIGLVDGLAHTLYQEIINKGPAAATWGLKGDKACP